MLVRSAFTSASSGSARPSFIAAARMSSRPIRGPRIPVSTPRSLSRSTHRTRVFIVHVYTRCSLFQSLVVGYATEQAFMRGKEVMSGDGGLRVVPDLRCSPRADRDLVPQLRREVPRADPTARGGARQGPRGTRKRDRGDRAASLGGSRRGGERRRKRGARGVGGDRGRGSADRVASRGRGSGPDPVRRAD